MLLGVEDDREERPALVPSLFPLIPPTLYFSTANEKGQVRAGAGWPVGHMKSDDVTMTLVFLFRLLFSDHVNRFNRSLVKFI